MGKIQSNDVDTGADEIPKDGHGIGRGSKRGDDFGAALADRLVECGFGERHECSRGSAVGEDGSYLGYDGFILHGDR
jgi:hypothetical protein